MPKAQPQKSQQNIAMAKNSLIVAALALLALCSVIQAAPYQELEPRKGHVPVYIRHGNEPLSDIHPGLAEAFKEEGQSKALEAESLVTEIPEAAATSSPTTSAPATSSTESDIASFETIKAQAKE